MRAALTSSRSTLRKRLASTGVEPTTGSKQWDPLFSYEKRLLNLASKDAALVQEAGACHLRAVTNGKRLRLMRMTYL